MIERRVTGEKPKTTLPRGAIDTQLHVYLPGFPAQPGGPDLPEGMPGLAEYRQVMAWLGIERFVITQGNAHQHDNGKRRDEPDAVLSTRQARFQRSPLSCAGVRQ